MYYWIATSKHKALVLLVKAWYYMLILLSTRWKRAYLPFFNNCKIIAFTITAWVENFTACAVRILTFSGIGRVSEIWVFCSNIDKF